ncbi:U3 small nucleolar RNA-associated protein [Lophium mytilinum]|uniref:U3 small nucleolar RNA-associated protein n=1 Tax=Lophium mytilinum TaxID=390894 RepID=A0A6A6QVA8_9PEZI|nr:U3 small nucleolar RNA-associated protein [Lophium mytilinum]
MAPVKTKAPSKKQWKPELPEETNAQALIKAPTPDESSGDDQEEFAGFDDNESEEDQAEMEGEDSAGDWEKDATEEALERAVFGDAVGFREGLRSFAADERGGLDDEDGQDNGMELERLADADLFFVDSGPAPAPAGGESSDSEDGEFRGKHREQPAWEDSDDERISVSLASVPRLRKLRKTEEEDVINGREYVKRLRKQYERLHPTPDWARTAMVKKRRRSDAAGSDTDSSADEMDVDEDAISVQPLAKLLQDADMLTRGSNSGSNKRRKLQPEVLDIQRMKDVSGALPSAITSLSFHPTLPLLLSSGPASTLYLHHIHPHPPNPNPLLTSLHIKRNPLTTTAFHPTDSRVFLSARRRYFHIWNLTTGLVEKVTRVYGHQDEQRSMEDFSLSPNGQYMALKGTARKGGGVVNFLNAYTLQWIAQCRVDGLGGIADFAWWGDGRGITIASKNGEVSEWNVEEKRLVGRWVDDGAVGTTTIALGGKSGRDGWIGGDRWVAIGSSSGIVNIYDRRAWSANRKKQSSDSDDEEEVVVNGGIPKAPVPTRVLDHLTTPTSHLAFSPDGQLLAMSSRWKNNALRLVHLPSCTVYRNWPTDKTPLGRITAIAWGKADREEALAFLSVANEQGKIKLWEVRA